MDRRWTRVGLPCHPDDLNYAFNPSRAVDLRVRCTGKLPGLAYLSRHSMLEGPTRSHRTNISTRPRTTVVDREAGGVCPGAARQACEAGG